MEQISSDDVGHQGPPRVSHAGLKEAEEKMTKFKLIAVKAKKELAEVKKQLETVVADKCLVQEELCVTKSSLDNVKVQLQQNVENYKSLQNDYDALQDKLDSSASEIKTLNVNLTAATQELTSLKESRANAEEEDCLRKNEISALVSEKKAQEARIKELDANVTCLHELFEKEKKGKAEAVSDHKDLMKKISLMEEQMANERNEFEGKLSAAVAEAKINNVMDLEIADYEHTIADLQSQVSSKESEIDSMDVEINRLQDILRANQEQLEIVESQRVQAEDRGNVLKTILDDEKKQLAEININIAELTSANAKLKSKLEVLTQMCEDYKVQVSEVAADKLSVEERLASVMQSHQQTVRSLESRINSLQSELSTALAEYDSCQAEYEGYKVRVCSVLKHQQKKTAPLLMGTDQEKAEKERLEKVVQQLRTRLQEMTETRSSLESDNIAMQEEHDRLLTRHSKLLQDFQDRETFWKEKLEKQRQLESDQQLEYDHRVRQLLLQNEKLNVTLKEQVDVIRESNKELAETRDQLQLKDEEIYRFQSEQLQLQVSAKQSKTDISKSSKTIEEMTDHLPAVYKLEERQQGEGSEFTDTQLLSPLVRQDSLTSTIPLEELLNPSEDKQSISSRASVDKETLKGRLSVFQKKIDHLSGLLQESEEQVARLSEQSIVLKSEIRRLERNQEREEHAKNLEYLKNVILKFLTLKTPDEKNHLIPVLVTMLKLNQHETEQVTEFVNNGEMPETQGGDGSGWKNYLHRWSGLT